MRKMLAVGLLVDSICYESGYDYFLAIQPTASIAAGHHPPKPRRLCSVHKLISSLGLASTIQVLMKA
jgi:hypothetical protein